MARIAKCGRYTSGWTVRCVIGQCPDLFQTRSGILLGVQGRARKVIVTSAAVITPVPLGFTFVNPGAIEQHHFEEVCGCLGSVNRPCEAISRQLWKKAAVVNMGMGQQNKID